MAILYEKQTQTEVEFVLKPACDTSHVRFLLTLIVRNLIFNQITTRTDGTRREISSLAESRELVCVSKNRRHDEHFDEHFELIFKWWCRFAVVLYSSADKKTTSVLDNSFVNSFCRNLETWHSRSC